jgi:hypothetical protein
MWWPVLVSGLSQFWRTRLEQVSRSLAHQPAHSPHGWLLPFIQLHKRVARHVTATSRVVAGISPAPRLSRSYALVFGEPGGDRTHLPIFDLAQQAYPAL